jgi:hypothetical protein
MQNPQDNDQHIDFQKELYQLLSQDSSCDDELCLISNLPLDDNPIELSCTHKFNYNSIFNEVKYQKTHSHHLETQKLSHSEIKCPYCRTIQKGLLPCRTNYENITGVNWPKKYQYKSNICGYTFLSGKRKGVTCGKKCLAKHCEGHAKILESREAKKALKENKLKEKIENEKIYETGIPTCQYVYKRGKNKGTQCMCKKPFPSTHDVMQFPWYCKSHYKHFKHTNQETLIGQNIVIHV